MSAAADLARDLGRRVDLHELIEAVVTLEPRQAEALCLTLWALPVELVRDLVARNKTWMLNRREGYGQRAVARLMGVAQPSVSALLKRAVPNVRAYLATDPGMSRVDEMQTPT